MLLTFIDYQALTGDTTLASADFATLEPRAEGLLADRLGRAQCEQGTIVEPLLADRTGRFYPTCTPLVSATGYEVDGATLTGGSGSELATVTYVGGWTPVGQDQTGRTTVPSSVLADLAQAVRTLSKPAGATPVGATSVRVGDVGVSYGPAGAPATGGADGVRWSAATLRYQHRRMVGI